MRLLLDIGNTNTHVGLAGRKVRRNVDIPTENWRTDAAMKQLRQFIGPGRIDGAALCSVVPRVTPRVRRAVKALTDRVADELTAATLTGVGVDYPEPASIGADRLANALAVRHHFGCPAVVVGFGTAVAFDVVNRAGNYIGGIIAPGLSAMTDYLHEKTALLPRIRLRDTRSVVGRSTEEAMLIGAVHGYRGLIRELIRELRDELQCRRLPVIATGGYAALISRSLPEITKVEPLLTLEGLRLFAELRSTGLRSG
jgi:type III pantothenate kinase